MKLTKTTVSTTILFTTALLLGACSSSDEPAASQPANDEGTVNPGEGQASSPAEDPPAFPGDGTDDAPDTDTPADPGAGSGDGPVTETPTEPGTGAGDGPVTGPPVEPGPGEDDGPVTEPPAGPGEPVDSPIPGLPSIPTLPADGPDAPEIPDTPNTSELPGTADTSAIAGLWNLSEEEFFLGESEGIDVFYAEISADGKATYYDYQQDEVDMGDNCYEIESGLIRFLGNNRYVVDPGTIDEIEPTIVRDGNTLNVSYVDVNDDNDNEDVTETLSFSYPLLTGVDPVFNECTE